MYQEGRRTRVLKPKEEAELGSVSSDADEQDCVGGDDDGQSVEPSVT